MYTNYFDGFTEAMVRKLTPDDPWDVHTVTLTYDEWREDVARPLRVGWNGRYRMTVVTNERGLLLLEELHIPLATELTAAIARLEAVEQLVREALPPSLKDTDSLRTAVVVYADDLDVAPRDERVQPVLDEEDPSSTLERLFDELFLSEPDPEGVDELFECLRESWEIFGQDDWLAQYREVDAA